MPVTTEVTGISPEISPYNPGIVSDGEISSEMPVTQVETGISHEISPSEKNKKKEKKIIGEICSEMPVPTEATGISLEISL